MVEEIKNGNTYFLNLTFPTYVDSDIDMKSAFLSSDAMFKLYVKDRFVCFSPEQFISIEDNTISTYPMKGTIDASIEDAKNKILSDEKEKAEHVMVVDLLRNDLSKVATEVRVEEFRFTQTVRAGGKELLQVSSKITGVLEADWHEKIGDILKQMLPAGSITGAPKKKTMEIIAKAEGYDRGFFTGVFGIYDGKTLNSAVMIRFLEKDEKGYLFKSGGGITLHSDALKEYNEMCEKVYIPVL
ncbi:MAG: aminodeoxychorismate synthase component I [Sulfurospirillaceae bacterium]|nr:aminodeoxychorismate synthase component I [Sulfurospirillaceae bacterium]